MSILGDYDGPIYSPSQTSIFIECPLKWHLRYSTRYVPRYFNQKEIAGAVGTAFSTYQEKIGEGHDYAQDFAVAEMHQMLDQLRMTRECSERAANYLTTAETRLLSFIKLFNTNPKIPRSWELFDRERAFPEWGNSRIDVAYRTSMGDLGVLDYKTRGRLQANQRDKARREFGTSSQLYHYCAMLSDAYGEPVNQFSILMLTLEPKPWVDLWQFRIKPGTLAVWVAGRKQVWSDMTACKTGERTPNMADEHENKFGLCQYYDICFKHEFDESSLLNDFVIRS